MGRISAFVHRSWLKAGMRFKSDFYLYLALVFTVFVFADSLLLNITAKMKQSSFDLMIKHRLVVGKPDPDIVIVDIDEKSLASLAKDYGRWPWPRQVMGEFLDQLEKQRPKAVVYDILFSDPDVYNADSDAYFNDVIGRTDNTFFPFLRLDPKDDGLSKVVVSDIPGTRQPPGIDATAGQAKSDGTVAVVLPFLDAAIKGGRLGMHNIYPDDDGVARRYTVYREDYGRLVPSLPARIVETLGVRPPEKPEILLNWRGKPFTYHYVSFADVLTDMQDKVHKRAQNEFTGKIVIIGSTAAGLFDVKPTPMDRLFPGVEILATAVDNLKNNDYLRVPDTRYLNLVLSLLIVWATAAALYKNVGPEVLDKVFGASQFLLIAISYASINLMTTYINLTGPVMVGLAYFTCAKIYSLGAMKALERSAVSSSISSEGELYAAVMLVRLGGTAGPAGEKAAARIRRGLEKRLRYAKGVDMIKGSQRGIWGLFEGTVVVSWTCPAGDENAKGLINEEALTVEVSATRLWQAAGGEPDGISFVFKDGRFDGGGRARAGWSSLFGEALMCRDDSEGKTT